jgi:hypothetical protein
MLTWTEYWNLLFAISLWCCGFYAISREGMIFGFILKFFERSKTLEKVGLPVVRCITCMASFHSLIIYGAYSYSHRIDFNFFVWALLAIPIAFTNTLGWHILRHIENLNELAKKNES